MDLKQAIFLCNKILLIIIPCISLTDFIDLRKIAGSMPKAPRRITSCGFQTGLTILVKTMIKDYHSTFFSSFGIRVCESQGL